jgi:hypothetical protein
MPMKLKELFLQEVCLQKQQKEQFLYSTYGMVSLQTFFKLVTLR